MTSGNPNDVPSTPVMESRLSKLADDFADAAKEYAAFDAQKEQQLKEIAAQLEATKQSLAEIQEKTPKDIHIQEKVMREANIASLQVAEVFLSKADSDGNFALDEVLGGPLCELLKAGAWLHNVDPQKMRLSDLLSPSLIANLHAQKVAILEQKYSEVEAKRAKISLKRKAFEEADGIKKRPFDGPN